MKVKLFSMVVILLINEVSIAQNTWQAQASGLSTALNSVFFIDVHRGWAVGSGGVILTTQNSGITWSTQSSGITTDLNGVFFQDALKGWAVGSAGKILVTDNGGATWTPQTSNTAQNLFKVDFARIDTGWAVGINDAILHTVDGGINWVDQTSTAVPNLYSIDAIDGLNAWICGYSNPSNGKILHTTNGGQNWDVVSTGTSILNSIHFYNTLVGWSVGQNGAILHTTDGGLNWGLQSSGTSESLLDIFALDQDIVWAIGANGTMLYSDNGGSNWQSVNSGLSVTLKDLFFVDSYRGWFCGSAGHIQYNRSSESICMVSYDIDNGRNLIVWDRIPNQKTAYYEIFRYSTGNVYNSIGTLPYNEISEFVDVNSSPETNSERYKIKAVDSLDIESDFSPYHETVNLQASLGVPLSTVVLNWNAYIDESGDFLPNSYQIFRGTTSSNMQLLIELPSSNTSYNDVNVYEPMYYQIVINRSTPCTPSDINNSRASGGPYYQSTSNLEDEGIINSIANLNRSQSFSISPNPADDYFTLTIKDEEIKNTDIEILNLQGQAVKQFKIENLSDRLIDSKLRINTEGLPSGVYMVKIGAFTKRLIIQ